MIHDPRLSTPEAATTFRAVPATMASTTPWAQELAARLFAIPARWGWQAADYPLPDTPAGLDLASPPPWTDPPRPDTHHLDRILSAAKQRLAVSIALTVVAALALAILSGKIAEHFDHSVSQAYLIASVVILGLCVINILGKVGPVYIAARNLREFLGPYRQAVAQERQRHAHAVREWEQAVRQHRQAVAQVETRQIQGPLWFPVHPASEPTRVDVFGGDPHRHGWASLLVTLGASVLAGGRRITLLDFTGQHVGDGLLTVAQSSGLTTRRIDLPADGAHVNLFDTLSTSEIADCLAYAVTERQETGDLRHERALAREVVQRVAGCLDHPVSFARLAAGIQVLRQTTPADGVLSPAEVNRLAEQVGEVGQDESAARQLRLMASQLRVLAEVASGAHPGQPLFSDAAVSLITTAGGRSDRKDLLDRVLIQLVQRALPDLGRGGGVLIVAGVDQLGAATVDMLGDHAHQAGVRLLLMIDQPQGEVEKTAGTGGAVCFMKMYNHRDAAIAAEFIGRGHKFVISQVTQQTGKSFTEGGGHNFSAETERGSTAQLGEIRERGQETELTESRAHTWTGVRNYSFAQNLSHSSTSGRVYEFTVDPQQILGMPETAFILVDNTAHPRRVVIADSNPGICLLDRVSLTPA